MAGSIGDNHPLKPLRSMKTLRRCQLRLDIALNLLQCDQETETSLAVGMARREYHQEGPEHVEHEDLHAPGQGHRSR